MLQVIFTTLYQLWLSRNNARDAQQIEDPVAVVVRVVALVDEWNELNVAKESYTAPRMDR